MKINVTGREEGKLVCMGREEGYTDFGREDVWQREREREGGRDGGRKGGRDGGREEER